MRCEAGLDAAIQKISKIYARVIEEWRTGPVADPVAESAATAAYLQQLEPRVKGHDRALSTLVDELATNHYAHASKLTELAEGMRATLNSERTTREALENRYQAAERERTALRAEIEAIRQLRTYRLRGWLMQWPRLVSIYQSLSGRSPTRPSLLT